MTRDPKLMIARRHETRGAQAATQGLSRRQLLLGGCALGAALFALGRGRAATPAPPDKRAPNVKIEAFSAAGKSEGVSELPRVVKSDDEWRQELPPDSYRVTRHEGTEPPFSGKY